MYINHNGMASNVANTLTSHYSNLATSTQRLSSGLRVNSAADDAAGLAIRELMRADIASLNQGVRNANDAISMIQTADGALGIIDEKLIRMKELAEQAATGTYDSTQRLMIESEYQAMASEITRIANATDFNGMKLLDGTLQGTHDGSGRSAEDGLSSTGAMKIHFGTGNDSAEDYYYIEIKEMTAQALGLGNASTWKDVQERGTDAFKKSLTDQIKADKTISDQERADMLAEVDKAVEQLNTALANATDYRQAHKYWASASDAEGFMPEGKDFPGNSSLMTEYLTAANAATTQGGPTAITDIEAKITNAIKDALPVQGEVKWETDKEKYAAQATEMWNKLENTIKQSASEAGMLDEEITLMMYGEDGQGGMKAAWKDKMMQEGANNWPPANNTAGDVLLNAAITNITSAAAPTPTTGSGSYSVKSFLGTAHPDFGGTTTYGDVIALRNTSYSEYVNATDDAKPNVGPTDADMVVAEMTAAMEEAWGKIDTTQIGDLSATTSGAGKEYAKVLQALEDKAKELGFTEAEAQAIKTELAKKANMALDADTPGEITAGTASADWKAAKDTLADALKGLNNKATTAAFNTAFVGGVGSNPMETAGLESTDVTSAAGLAIRNQGAAAAKANDKLDEFWNSLRDTEKQKLQYAWGKAAMHNLANAEIDRDTPHYGINAGNFDFNTALGLDASGLDVKTIDNNILAQALKDANAQVSKMDFAGHTIETQEDAQQALDAINDAITEKDKVRAHLGALQNRLENTVSNLTIQAENLQAAESRISDVDVATEMTNFVRNQILTQSAVAMLSQANSMPQMAMQLIGG